MAKSEPAMVIANDRFSLGTNFHSFERVALLTEALPREGFIG